MRAVRLFPRAQDVFAEIEIARFAGQPVKQHHRLQHAGRRHAHVMAGLDDVALARLIAEGLAQQIRHAPAGGQRRHVSRVAHVSDQADQVVFVRPHIPFGPAILLQIGAEITVCQLALAEFRHGVIELRAQGRIAGVNPRQRGGMEPFADVLAIPGLPARTLAVAFQQARRVDLRPGDCFRWRRCGVPPIRSDAPGRESGSPADPQPRRRSFPARG